MISIQHPDAPCDTCGSPIFRGAPLHVAPPWALASTTPLCIDAKGNLGKPVSVDWVETLHSLLGPGLARDLIGAIIRAVPNRTLLHLTNI